MGHIILTVFAVLTLLDLSTVAQVLPLAPTCAFSAVRNISASSFSAGPLRLAPGPINTTTLFLDCFSWAIIPLSTDPLCLAAINETTFTFESQVQRGVGSPANQSFRATFGGSVLTEAIWYNYSASVDVLVRSPALPQVPSCTFTLHWSYSLYASFRIPTTTDVLPWLVQANPMVMVKGRTMNFTFQKFNNGVAGYRFSLATEDQYCTGLPPTGNPFPLPTLPVPDRDPRYANMVWTIQGGVPNEGYYFICIQPPNSIQWYEANIVDVHGGNPAYFKVLDEAASGGSVTANVEHTLAFYGLNLDLRPGHDTAKAVYATHSCATGVAVSLGTDLGPSDDYGYNVTVALWKVTLGVGSYRICYQRFGSAWTQVHFYDQVPPLAKNVIRDFQSLNTTAPQPIPPPPTPMPPGVTPAPTAVLDPNSTFTTVPNSTQSPQPTNTSAPPTTEAPQPTNTSAPPPTDAPQPTNTSAPPPTDAPQATIPCFTGTVPPAFQKDQSIIRNPYVSLVMSSNVVNPSFQSTVAQSLCISVAAVRLLSKQPELINGEYILNVSIRCLPHECANTDRMDYLEYMLMYDTLLAHELGVQAAARAPATGGLLSVGPQSSPPNAGVISLIAIGSLLVVLTVVLIVVVVRRHRRRDSYRNHMDFSPEHPSREVELDAGRREFPDIDDTTPRMVLELNDVVVVDKKAASDDPDD